MWSVECRVYVDLCDKLFLILMICSCTYYNELCQLSIKGKNFRGFISVRVSRTPFFRDSESRCTVGVSNAFCFSVKRTRLFRSADSLDLLFARWCRLRIGIATDARACVRVNGYMYVSSIAVYVCVPTYVRKLHALNHAFCPRPSLYPQKTRV